MNIELLTRVVQWAVNESKWDERQRPESDVPAWDQGIWGKGHVVPQIIEAEPPEDDRYAGNRYMPVRCDSSCCLAGNATMLNGDTFVVPAREHRVRDFDADIVEVTRIITRDTGEIMSVSERAAHLLGLDTYEAGLLFAGGNDVEEVVGYADAIAQHHGHNLVLTGAEEIYDTDLYASSINAARDHMGWRS